MTSNAKVGVVCGSGALPLMVARGLISQDRDYILIGYKGAVGDWIRSHPHVMVSIGQVGKLFHTLKTAGCADVVFAGGLARPTLGTFRVDFTAARLAPRVVGLFRQGDDGLLRGLAKVFEEYGFRMVGADTFVPDALAAAGALTAAKPTLRDRSDIAAGAELLAALGPHDVGQAAVMAGGVCLAVEAVEGTQRMLERVAGFPNYRRGGAPRPSGVLIKTPKPDQDRRFDLPAIGPDTIDQAHAAGLNGVAIAAGEVFILDRAETIRRADAKGVFVVGVPQGAV